MSQSLLLSFHTLHPSSLFQKFGKAVYSSTQATANSSTSTKDLLALDCEMVGVIDHNQRNARGAPKMVSALGKVLTFQSSVTLSQISPRPAAYSF